MTIKRIAPLPAPAEARRARGPQPLTPAHELLIAILADILADREPDPPATPPEKGEGS